ncbi:MAG: hypothetical protein OEY25_10930 [Candidatus Aminicenantes bacterium]|nr:hypothetical protein [Candidatus Aminicenantes bacterium]
MSRRSPKGTLVHESPITRPGMHYLEKRRLSAKDDASHIAISPVAVGGLWIRLVQKE